VKGQTYTSEIKERAVRIMIKALDGYPLRGQPSKPSLISFFLRI
jgi:hypothetical protein